MKASPPARASNSAPEPTDRDAVTKGATDHRGARLLTLGVPLVLPFLAVAAVPRLFLPRIAEAASRPLSQAADAIAESLEPPPPPRPLPPTKEAAAIEAIDGEPAEAVSPRAAEACAQAPPPPLGVMVSRGRVIAAAKAGIRPSGSGVSATPYRPSGLALHGVGAVGVGLRDGDVVTRVGGARATSQGAVVGAVTSALRQKLPAITAEVWRGQRRILVTVELPSVEMETGSLKTASLETAELDDGDP
ncbi:MAG: hypothetical protein R3B72_22060 [Polyangiaceae bacterium]